MPRSLLHKAARSYARGGTPVFPCIPKTKKPLTSHGFQDATTDLAQIDAWWTEHPNANIAFCPGSVNQGIVDLDGEAGLKAWGILEWVEDTPETYVVRTPRGGQHWYYLGAVAPQLNRALIIHANAHDQA
jgi:hypothetical protein